MQSLSVLECDLCAEAVDIVRFGVPNSQCLEVIGPVELVQQLEPCESRLTTNVRRVVHKQISTSLHVDWDDIDV